MRILMLSQFYPPIIGGEEQYVRTLSIELVSRGHDVAVVTFWHKGLDEFELDQGVRVYRIRSLMQRLPYLFSDGGRQYAPPFPDPGTLIALRRIVEVEQPEIVHAHNWLVHSFLPLKSWSRARLVVTLHNYNLVCAKTTLLYHQALCVGPGPMKCLECASRHYGPAKGVPSVISNWIMRLIEQGVVDTFLTPSQAVAKGNNLVGSRLRFQVIPNFMPSHIEVGEDIYSYISQLPANDYLLFVGALNRQKGVDVLLRAYGGLTNAPPLVLIGYQTSEWPMLCMDRSPNVLVLQDWPRYAVMEAWRRCTIALAPSVGPEAFSIGVMEAMSFGRPVIASRIGGLVDLVTNGETGLLVEPGDPVALQTAIEHLLATLDLRERMGQVALDKVVKFQASTVVPRIEAVYQSLVKKGNFPQSAHLHEDNVGVSDA